MIMISLTDDHDITHWSLMTEEELLTVGTDVPVLGPPATQNAHSPSDISDIHQPSIRYWAGHGDLTLINEEKEK